MYRERERERTKSQSIFESCKQIS
uniref:Uncharacterized protein n=1 Tax=Musa acuminata subsp. malaccensis TaxID=214687 RepID=A0A804I6D2_MUSAM